MVATPAIDYDQIARKVTDALFLKALPETLSQAVASKNLMRYQQDPMGFAREQLNISLTEDIGKILESVRDNRITVVRSATGPGKTHGASVAACWFYKCFPDSRVYTTANPFDNQKILWGELSNIIQKNGRLFASDRITNMLVKRSDTDFIEALSIPTTGTEAVKEGKFSGHHHAHQLFIVDEGDTCPDFVYRGIEGCMSGGILARLLILFNPRYEAGTPYRMERDKMAKVIHLSAFNHPNVLTGKEVIPGAVNRPTTVQRINEWCRPLRDDEQATVNCFLLPDFLVGATAPHKGGHGEYPPLQAGQYLVQDPAFHYMVLGQYPPQPASQLISREWVEAARSRWDVYTATYGEVPPFGTMGVQGGDVAEFGVDSNVSCIRYGGFVARMKDWGGMDVLQSADRFALDYQENNVRSAYIDATGLGAGVAPEMQRKGCVAIAVKVAESPTEATDQGEFAQLRDQLWWACREWLRTDPGAMLPPDENLIQELLTPTYEPDRRGKIKVMPKNRSEGRVCMKELLKRSPDRAEALVMTFAEGSYVFEDMDFR